MADILIVDDDAAIRELFKFVFEDAGHAVRLARDGREGLAAALAAPPAFIVLDIAMPNMTGAEFAAQLAALVAARRLPRIPFVVMTGENFMDERLDKIFAAAPGFVRFFPKMTPPEEVVAAAEAALAG